MTTDTKLWHRTVWMEAVWASADLRPLEKLVAAVYADHARDKSHAWVTLDRLVERSGLGREAANNHRKGLETKGWLIARERVHRRVVDFDMAVPTVARSSPTEPPTSSPTEPPDNSGSSADDIGSSVHDIGSSPTELHSSTNPSTNPSLSPAEKTPGPDSPAASRREDERETSLTPNQRAVVKKLDISHDDPRIGSIEAMLEHHNVRSARAWVNKIPIEDLADNLDTQHAQATQATRGGKKGYRNPNYIEGINSRHCDAKTYWTYYMGELGIKPVTAGIIHEDRVNCGETGDEAWKNAHALAGMGVYCRACGADITGPDPEQEHQAWCELPEPPEAPRCPRHGTDLVPDRCQTCEDLTNGETA